MKNPNPQEHFITGKPYANKKEARYQAINWFERFLGGQDSTSTSLKACYDRSLLFYDKMDSIFANSSSDDLSSKIQSLYQEYSKAFNNLKHYTESILLEYIQPKPQSDPKTYVLIVLQCPKGEIYFAPKFDPKHGKYGDIPTVDFLRAYLEGPLKNSKYLNVSNNYF